MALNGSAPPLPDVEAICAAEGVDCGFGDPVRVLAVGNESLELEEIQTIEVGYSGIWGDKAFFTVDVYQSDNEQFITDLIPQFDSMGNVTNPNFGAYQPPSELSATGAQHVSAPPLITMLSNCSLSPVLTYHSHRLSGALTQVSVLSA